jgi:N-acetylneuraminate synthase
MTVSTTMRIGNRLVGSGEPVYVVAELSANHRQRYDEAETLVRAAGAAGADAVKVQTFTPDTITMKSDRDSFRLQGGTLWDGRTLYELYEEAYMPWEWQPKLKDVAVGLGLDFFSSPFDPTAVAFLEKMGVPAYKVASFEIVDIPLIETIARTGKPIILSTGMATKDEIREAVNAASRSGTKEIALLKCNSGYPAPPEEMNLSTIPEMRKVFGLPVGLSDHTFGIATPIAAVVLGASIVEKHFTLSRRVAGPDSAFSLEPEEFREMVDGIRTAEKAFGSPRYGPTAAELKSLPFRRSLFVVTDMKTGGVFSEQNVRSIRPANGLHPRHLKEVLGRRASEDIAAGTPLKWNLIA